MLIIGGKLIHNHEPETKEDLLRHDLKMQCRKRGLEEKNEPPSKVIVKEISSQDPCQQDELIQASADSAGALRQAVYRERRKLFPTLPKSRQEAQESLASVGFTSSRGEDMICVNDVNTGLVILATKDGLSTLCSTTDAYGDGTFKYAPKHFLQLYTLHGCRDGTYMPCVFALLPSKERLVYKQMFQCIVDACNGHQLILNPSSLYLDFESAVHDAARDVWPAIQIKGCLFHLGQNWWRQIQKLDLAMEYKTSDTDGSKWLRHCFGLPFLPAEEVEDAFAFDMMSNIPDESRLHRFSDYLLNNYVKEDSRFRPNIWASFTKEHRTTNACESFHSHLKRMFYSHSPHLFTFLENLRLLETEASLKRRSSRRYMRKEERDKLQKREEAQRLYTEGSIDRYRYIQKVAYLGQPKLNVQ